MHERPMLFSAPMVRALLAGTKTQTRRVVKNPAADGSVDRWPFVEGMRLWVKETFYCDHCFAKDYELTANAGRVGPRMEPDRAACEAEWREQIWYNADAPIRDGYWAEGTPPLTPSLFMPRWASRITLEITDVRDERLQAISESDAIAEGCIAGCAATPIAQYKALWDGLNGKRKGCAWADNPWVWRIEFKRVKP